MSKALKFIAVVAVGYLIIAAAFGWYIYSANDGALPPGGAVVAGLLWPVSIFVAAWVAYKMKNDGQ